MKVPKGVNDGSLLRLAGQGEAGLRGGPKGDLYVAIHLKPHNIFERRGSDVYVEYLIEFYQVALGATVKVPALNGTIDLIIPSGTKTGTRFKISNKGFPEMDRNRYGDEYVIVTIKTPTYLSEKQKRLLQEFANS